MAGEGEGLGASPPLVLPPATQAHLPVADFLICVWLESILLDRLKKINDDEDYKFNKNLILFRMHIENIVY